MKGEVIDQMYLGFLEGQIFLRKEREKATFCIEAVQRTQSDHSRQSKACRKYVSKVPNQQQATEL